MAWFIETTNSSLSIDELLAEARERKMVALKREWLERSGFAEWKIWKLLRIDWK